MDNIATTQYNCSGNDHYQQGNCVIPTELHLIYLEMALSNKRRSQKHGGFYVTGGYLADKECGVGVSWRGTTPLKQYKVNFSQCI